MLSKIIKNSKQTKEKGAYHRHTNWQGGLKPVWTGTTCPFPLEIYRTQLHPDKEQKNLQHQALQK